MKLNSKLIHGGVDGDKTTGAVNVPVYLTSTYKQPRFGENLGYEYSRTGNPTREAVEKLIAELENGVRGFAFASGMAAITAVLNLFNSGDKILINDNLYGGTFRVIDKIFSNFNLTYEVVKDFNSYDFNSVDKSVKAVIIETPTNPLLTITDLEKVSKAAKKAGLLTIVDNTFMTPYLQNPLDFGVDIVVHSATKYLGGHSDTVAGLVVVNSEELGERLHFIQNSTGGVLPPFDSYLLIRGIKTLSVRLDRHLENAKAIVEFLQEQDAIEKIYYPGIEEHPGYEINKKQARGAGAVISFALKKNYDFKKFINSLELITYGESLGGVESLLCHPATMTHAALPEDAREALGINERLLRLSVGIEDKNDLINEISRAIEVSRG